MPCILVHPLLDLGQCIYMTDRWFSPLVNTTRQNLTDVAQCTYIQEADEHIISKNVKKKNISYHKVTDCKIIYINYNL